METMNQKVAELTEDIREFQGVGDVQWATINGPHGAIAKITDSACENDLLSMQDEQYEGSPFENTQQPLLPNFRVEAFRSYELRIYPEPTTES